MSDFFNGDKIKDDKKTRVRTKKIKLVYSNMTSNDILKLTGIKGTFRNKLELCELAVKQGIEVVYPDSMLKNIKNFREA